MSFINCRRVLSSAIQFLTAILILSGCTTLSPTETKPRSSNKQDRAKRAAELFASFDLNSDGFLSASELNGGVRYLALGLNSNPNSDVMLGLQKKEKTSKAHKPKPRTLTSEEVRKVVEEAFAKSDNDLDQRLSKDEFKKMIVERPLQPDEKDAWEPFM